MSVAARFERWQSLRAWRGTSFRRVELLLRRRAAEESTGQTFRLVSGPSALRYQIVVRVGTDTHDAHATLLHEMAHVVMMERGLLNENHGPRFRRAERAAAEEVLGFALPANASLWRYGLVLAFGEALRKEHPRAASKTDWFSE